MAKDVICIRCGTQNKTKKVTKGTMLTEIILWLCLLVPGLIYSLWRVSSRYSACAACGSTELVPADSPVGRETIRKYRSVTPAA